MHYVGLLIATFFPPVIVALLNRGVFGGATIAYSPKTQHKLGPEGFPGWTKSFPYQGFSGQQTTANAYFWHFFDILIVIKISLAIMFIYSVQYTLNRATEFKSSGTITITVTKGGTDFKKLGESSTTSVTIDISSGGSIKKYNDPNKIPTTENLTDITTGTSLNPNDKLYIVATGTITQPANSSPVKLTGTIVVTSNNQQIGTSGLNFGGGPDRTGVSGTLTLEDVNEGGNKYVNISGSSLTINTAAYGIIKKASDTTSSSFTIGAADPRNIGSPHTSEIEKGTGTTYDFLANESSFTKYWQLLPSDRYSDKDIPDWTSVSPELMVLLIATIFPPMIVVILQITDKTSETKHSPKAYGGWGEHSLYYWHLVDLLIVIKITVATIFIYSLHTAILWTLAYGIYRDTQIKDAITGYTTGATSNSTIKYGTCPNPTNPTTTNGTATIQNPTNTGATFTITNIKDTTK